MPLMNLDGTDRLGFLIHDAARLMRKRFEALGSRHGLSSAQWRLLVRVVKSEGVTQARLAELLEVEPISVSRLLDRMEEGGWIERRQDLNDRRVRLIFPTDKSRQAFEAIKGVAGEVFEQALTGLSTAERQTLIRGLMTLVDNLSDGEVPCQQQAMKKGAA
ncbi:DNA-binding MarR family transcriptional regulator [Pseudaminobacter salicylatoxidans]|uniref:DNA-binding MarR family transcriptional regulator n=2 Tax=Pseudaminobacter salicylatoxidans TaxID=93369 RepID=A0A316BSV2_PSESE|nr:DNA-binding MarR family transcriptional regulator [Pseudaminobacter salicylatoxidans]